VAPGAARVALRAILHRAGGGGEREYSRASGRGNSRGGGERKVQYSTGSGRGNSRGGGERKVPSAL